MFLRSILYPSLVACAVGAPMLYSTGLPNQNDASMAQVGQQSSFSGEAIANQPFLPTPGNRSIPSPLPIMPTGSTSAAVARPPGVPGVSGPRTGTSAALQLPQFSNHSATPGGLATLPMTTSVPPSMIVSGPSVHQSTMVHPAVFGMTPDYGAAETFVFPGDAHGPDLSAEPTDFIPVTNLAEIIRFDVYPNWVKNRWKRVSTNPGDAGLHGLRVALVTGTNSWDLHGSLTYYFDVNQRAQRITFRGWTGDTSRLVNLLTSQFALKAQPTHWAGAYAAQNDRGVPTAGLLMKHPTVITRENPVQQVALVMEINHAQGSFSLSPSFVNMLRYAVTQQ